MLRGDTDPVDRLLARIDGVRRSGTGWVARCPGHDDRHASLSIASGWDGRVLANCHAGCATKTVVEAVGLMMADLFPASDDPPSEETVYEVRDAMGAVQGYHVRSDDRNGKRMAWRNAAGTWGLAGRSTNSMPLYGSEHVAAWGDEQPIYMTEGQKAADAALAAGLRAVATVTGSSGCPTRNVLSVLKRPGRDPLARQ